MLLRAPFLGPSLLRRLLHYHHLPSSSAAAADAADLWVAKALSTAFLLSPSPSDSLLPFRGALSPLAALEAVRRLTRPRTALALFKLTRSVLGVAHRADAYWFLVGFLCQSGLHADALKLFDEMLRDGHSPDVPFIGYLADSLAEAGLLDSAMGLLARAPEFGFHVGPYTFNKVISLLVRRNRVQDASFFFRQHLGSQFFTPDTWSFNIILKGLCRVGDIEGAVEVFETMRTSQCSPDTVTHNILVDGLCRAKQVDKGYEMLRKIETDGSCLPNVITYTSLISGYCKMGRMEEAFRVFTDMICMRISPNIVTYNVLIDGYGKVGDMSSASSLYEQMILSGCPPDIVTLTSLIDGYCRGGQLDDAMKLWHEISQKELQPNVYTFSIMISSLCKKNRLAEAQALLKELNRREDILARAFVYNPVIDGLCKIGDVDEANSILVQMEARRCIPDKHTYTILIIGCSMKGRMSEAISLFHRMVSTGCAPDEVTIRCLVTCLLKAGMPREANHILCTASGYSYSCRISSGLDVSLAARKSPDISLAV